MDGVEMVAQLMAISATTAPKSKGENFVHTKLLKGEIIKELGDAMLAFGERTKKKDFDRDSKNVAQSEAILLIRFGVLTASRWLLATGFWQMNAQSS